MGGLRHLPDDVVAAEEKCPARGGSRGTARLGFAARPGLHDRRAESSDLFAGGASGLVQAELGQATSEERKRLEALGSILAHGLNDLHRGFGPPVPAEQARQLQPRATILR